MAQGDAGGAQAVGGVCREEADDNGERKADEDGPAADSLYHRIRIRTHARGWVGVRTGGLTSGIDARLLRRGPEVAII